MRGVTGAFDGSRITFCEAARAKTKRIMADGNLCWDTEAMLRLAEQSIAVAGDVSSVGVDTWGADFGLIGRDGRLLFPPLSYRDPKAREAADAVFAAIPEYELYQSNGTLIEDICPLIQLCYLKKNMPALLERAGTFQLMSSLICFLLTGERTFDHTTASPSGLYDLRTDGWNKDFLKRLDLPDILPDTQDRRTVLGHTQEGIPVLRICGHDTASALMAVPEPRCDDVLYVSTGSWVMTGCFLREPVLTREAYDAGLSNENGFDGEINFLRYSNGLYIVQECAREWLEREHWVMDYGELEAQALLSGYDGQIDPDSAEFASPGGMCAKVSAYLEKTGQEAPRGRAEIYAAILNGIAERVARTAADISRILHKNFDRIYVLGGGAQSACLCRAIGRKTGQKLFAGPVEASAAGNIFTQLIRQKELSDRSEAAEVLRRSFTIKEF